MGGGSEPANAGRVRHVGPRGAGEVLDAAAELLCERFVACVLPVAGVWGLAQVVSRWIVAPLEAQGAGDPDLLEVSALAYLSWMLSLAVGVVTSAGLAPFVLGAAAGERVGVGAALRLVGRRGPALVVATALVALLAGIGLFPFVVPGLFVLWKLLFTGAVCSVEGRGPLASLARSVRLTRGGFLRWVPVFLVAYAATLPFSMGAGALHEGAARGWFGDLLPGDAGGALKGLVLVGSSLLLAIPTAYYALVVGVFYVDARVRHEGLDLALWLARLEAQRADPGPARPRREERGLA